LVGRRGLGVRPFKLRKGKALLLGIRVLWVGRRLGGIWPELRNLGGKIPSWGGLFIFPFKFSLVAILRHYREELIRAIIRILGLAPSFSFFQRRIYWGLNFQEKLFPISLKPVFIPYWRYPGREDEIFPFSLN